MTKSTTSDITSKTEQAPNASSGSAATAEDEVTRFLGPRASCSRCSARPRALGGTFCIDCKRHEKAVHNLAHHVHAGHTVDVGHMSTRLSSELIARIDRLVSTVGERATFATTRSAVLRRVIERGLVIVEHELGIADSPATATGGGERRTP